MQLVEDIVASTEERCRSVPQRPTKSKPGSGRAELEGLVGDGMPPSIGARRRDDRELQRRFTQLSNTGSPTTDAEHERILGSSDLVDEFYLHRAVAAARPVALVTTRSAGGRTTGAATGFMVSPSLLLTNWHVFEDAEQAAPSVVNFDYTLGVDGNPLPSPQFRLRPDLFFASDKALDFALVAVATTSRDGAVPLGRFGHHRLIPTTHKIEDGEWITIIQHPGGARRQFAIRENQLLQKLDRFLLYKSDTAPGSSGAPAFNDSFQVVALHHSGKARRDDANPALYVLRDGRRVPSLDGIDDAAVVWVANEGVRVSVLCEHFRRTLSPRDPYVRELFESMNGRTDIMSKVIDDRLELVRDAGGGPVQAPVGSGPPPMGVWPTAGGLAIPLTLYVSLGGPGGGPLGAPASPPLPPGGGGGLHIDEPPVIDDALETYKVPAIDTDYTNRSGYAPDFLPGVKVPLPRPKDPVLVAKLDDGTTEIPYQNFSILMHKQRRLALVCASNVDGTPQARKPEPGDYSRKGLSELGKNDVEQWATDPRIAEHHQLPDVFFKNDGGAFDKGHIVRREDVCWGSSFEAVKRANGDSFHTTNCSPQVAEFNRSNLEGRWGQLENEVLAQVKAQRYTLLAGPVLADDDPTFEGKDKRGKVKIQIPRAFWKVIFTVVDKKLQAFAFVLDQPLDDVPLVQDEQFTVRAEWRAEMVSISDLQDRLLITFDKAIHTADQFDAVPGEEIARGIGVSRRPRRDGGATPSAVVGAGRALSPPSNA